MWQLSQKFICEPYVYQWLLTLLCLFCGSLFFITQSILYMIKQQQQQKQIAWVRMHTYTWNCYDYSTILPFWQFCPSKPKGQSHSYPSFLGTQEPPLWQGALTQGWTVFPMLIAAVKSCFTSIVRSFKTIFV